MVTLTVGVDGPSAKAKGRPEVEDIPVEPNGQGHGVFASGEGEFARKIPGDLREARLAGSEVRRRDGIE